MSLLKTADGAWCKAPIHQFIAIAYPGTRLFTCYCNRIQVKHKIIEDHGGVVTFRVDLTRLEFTEKSATPTTDPVQDGFLR